MRRRQALSGLAATTSGVLLGLPGQGHARNTRRTGLLSASESGATSPGAIPVLRGELAAAHALFQDCRYADLAATLPTLITAMEVSREAADDNCCETLSALLADTYSLASNLCTKLQDDALAWVTADRARTAAHASGNVLSIAAASRVAAIALRRQGHHDTAITLLTNTALWQRDSLHPAQRDLLGTYGSLLCTASYTAAQHGDRNRALELIGEAEDTARQLSTPVTGQPVFSAVNVRIYQIGVRTALGDAGSALDHARRVEIRSLPNPERQARFCVDTARAWHRFGDLGRCYQALRAAEHFAPEELRRPSVWALLTELLHAPGPTPADLRAFAARIQARP